MRTAPVRIVIAFVVFLLAVAAAGALFVYSGVYDVSATRQHTAPVYWILEIVMRQSARRHARGIVAPPLDDGDRIARGRALYDDHCLRCHGAPGIAPEPFALGLMPQPANLAHTARVWPREELFYVVKQGIKATGMPAWKFRLTDDEMWAIVAFLQVMATMSPRDYRDAAGAVAAPSVAAARPPPALATDPARGKAALQQYACTTCHAIPGVVGAHAPVGPPLAHMGTRGFIAGIVPNTEDNLVRWLRNPQALHADSAMPDLGMSERDARDIAAFLRSLR
jgi:mono/diheme cytochrome c family protein